jgi:hypothetical protein
MTVKNLRSPLYQCMLIVLTEIKNQEIDKDNRGIYN